MSNSQYDWEKDDYLVERYQSELRAENWGAAIWGFAVGVVGTLMVIYYIIYTMGLTSCLGIEPM